MTSKIFIVMSTLLCAASHGAETFEPTWESVVVKDDASDTR